MTAPPRAQFRRVKGWRMVPGGVLCFRPHPLSNPFPVEDFGRAEAVERFQFWARAVLKAKRPLNKRWQRFRDAFHEAKAATKLYCFCRIDQPCRVDVLRRLMLEF